MSRAIDAAARAMFAVGNGSSFDHLPAHEQEQWRARARASHQVFQQMSLEARAEMAERARDAAQAAARLMLPFLDYAGGEGLCFAADELLEQPAMDAADICAAVAEKLGFELGDRGFLRLIQQGRKDLTAIPTTETSNAEVP